MYGKQNQKRSLVDDDFPQADIDVDSVYSFYTQHLFPAIYASLPLLMNRLWSDIQISLIDGWERALTFLVPNWQGPTNILHLMEQAASNSTINEFMMRHFDTNLDGHISTNELLNMTEILASLPSRHPQSWFQWFSRAWPLMDWKLGVFLWRTCGGLLLLLLVISLFPGRLHGLLGKILRWPVLGLTYFLITVELTVYTIIRLFIRIIETAFANSKHRRLRRLMRQSKTYKEWYSYANDLDESQGRGEWKKMIRDETACRYNWSFVKELIRDLRKSRNERDYLMALAVLQQCTRKNVGGIMSEESFSFTNTGEPKHIVKEFIEEVTITLHWVTDHCLKKSSQSMYIDNGDYESKLQRKVEEEKNKLWTSVLSWSTLNFDKSAEKFPLSRQNSLHISSSRSEDSSDNEKAENHPAVFNKEKIIVFLKRARAAYGRTALCLSGGAMMGLYHFGHVRALLEMGCLPNIVSGTSAGSVVAAIICTRTDDEIRRDLDPNVLVKHLKCFHLPWSKRIKNLWKNGCMFELDYWRELIEWFTCGDMTFEEAFKKTGRVFCITLSATTKKAPPVLINHISAPNVVIASAIIASAAVPGFVPPVRLEVKGPDGKISYQGHKDQTYWDGSIEQDIPTSGLAEMLNCQFFVAAQCNPHIVPFFYNCRGGVGRPSRWSSGTRENAWRGGFLLSALELYLKNDMKAKFQFLHDIEAAIGFTSTMMTQQFEGSTTIVPQVSFIDYFQLFTDPSVRDIIRYESVGAIAAYEHCAMIQFHYRVADALDECLKKLESKDLDGKITRRESSIFRKSHAAALSATLAEPDIASLSTETTGTGEDEYDGAGFGETETYVADPKRGLL
mmetsp:Transcript_17619/g.26702  ORF Transcript_17619/g.26702 Transcript_17619/m.26702 type:complete len:846 (-) Transcript_17619:55-2592(-)